MTDTRDATQIDVAANTLADLMNMELPPQRWAVPGILPEGLSILAGSPKLGKSWLALNLAIAIGTGSRALDSVQVEPGRVLYLALEDNLRRMQQRTATVLCGMTAPNTVHVELAWPRVNEGCVDKLRTFLDACDDTRLIIIDTLAKVKPIVRGRGSSSYDDDYAAITPLKKLADEYGVAVLLIHHLRKLGAEDPLDRISGTTGLTGAADSILMLQRARQQNTATLSITGRDVQEQELALTFAPIHATGQ